MRFKRAKRENGETARLMKLANLTREREYAWIRQKNVERAGQIESQSHVHPIE